MLYRGTEEEARTGTQAQSSVASSVGAMRRFFDDGSPAVASLLGPASTSMGAEDDVEAVGAADGAGAVEGAGAVDGPGTGAAATAVGCGLTACRIWRSGGSGTPSSPSSKAMIEQ